nr:DNA helicase [Tanacetum cinerariifolium]
NCQAKCLPPRKTANGQSTTTKFYYYYSHTRNGTWRLPLEYAHLGKCTCVCRHCGALFWECEKVARSSYTYDPRYNKCCYGGRVILRAPPEYPEVLPKGKKLVNVPGQSTKGDKRMSMNMYYSYQIHDRLNHYNLLLRGGKLFQQYVVTAYCAIEQSRLYYIRQKQSDIRNEYLSSLYDAIVRGDRDRSYLGSRTVLTAAFTGGPRYMYAHYLDALAICRVHGNPSFFITFTCNAKWPEIQEFMEAFPQLTTADRADIVDRVFEKKVRDYIKFVRNSRPFGDITADTLLYTIEFQKRGLPHCHSLLWISSSFKIREDSDVDKYILAELPDPIADGYSHFRDDDTRPMWHGK